MLRLSLGLGLAVVLLACVDDAAVVRPGPNAPDANIADAATPPNPDGSMPIVDGGPEACEGGTTLCGASCVDLQSSADNCNACGRACGGGTCTAGQCSPAVRVTGRAVTDFAIDGSELVFTAGDLVSSCPSAGPCAGAGLKKLADFTGANPAGTGAVAAVSGAVAFAGNTDGNARLYDCPLGSGCPANVVSKGVSMAGFPTIVAVPQNATTRVVYARAPMSGIQGYSCAGGTCTGLALAVSRDIASDLLAASPSELFYTAAVGGAVHRCPGNTFPCTGVPFIAPRARELAVTGDQRYVLYTSPQGRAAIGRCPATGCPGGMNAPTMLWQTIGDILTIAADGDEVFWAESGGGGLTLRGCRAGVGGNCNLPRDLAKLAIAPTKIIVTPKFLFWRDTAGEILTLAR